MKEKIKYCSELVHHKLAETYYYEKPGRMIAIGAVLASIGGFGAYSIGEEFDKAADHIRADNAQEVVQALEERRGDLEDKRNELQSLTQQIAEAGRSGQDITGLEAERESKVSGFQSYAAQVVSDAFLSSELSEQERQDFIGAIDTEIIDLGDIGLGALEQDDKVMEFSHVREGRTEIDKTRPLLDNFERVQAIAEYNEENNINLLFLTLLATVFSGFLGTLGLAVTVGENSEAARNKPKKPAKNHGLRH